MIAESDSLLATDKSQPTLLEYAALTGSSNEEYSALNYDSRTYSSNTDFSYQFYTAPQSTVTPSTSPALELDIDEFSIAGAPGHVDSLFGDGASWTGTSGQAVTIQYAINTTFDDHPLGAGINLSNTVATTVRSILSVWASYANITFQEVAAADAELKIINYDLADGVAGVTYTWSYAGGDQIAKSVVSADIEQNNFTLGGYGYLTYLHEIGHALGLKHPGNYNAGGGGANGPYLTDFGLTDSRDYTVMSYYEGVKTANVNPSSGMLYDIATIQALYGVNSNYNSGNNSYTLNGASKVWTLWDGGGTDTINTVAYTAAATIDLREGASYGSDVGSNNFWIAFGANIENITAGRGADTLHGNALDNSFNAGGGNDTVNGHEGSDLAVYIGDYFGYTITVVNATTITVQDIFVDNGSEGLDTLIDIERLSFGGVLFGFDGTSVVQTGLQSVGNHTAGNDTIYGTALDNLIQGGEGNDKLFGRGGHDLIQGGNGTDGILGEDGNDTIYGAAGNDQIIGGNGRDEIYGEADSDVLWGGLEADVMYGGLGTDMLYGEAGKDVLYGDAGADTIYGGDDNDAIFGGENDLTDTADKLYGGAGNDSIYGGGGNDAITGEVGADKLYGHNGDDRVYGGSENDSIWGGEGNDTLWGDGGNDSIQGDNGNDLLYGGASEDAILGEAGNDTLWGGLGLDTLNGGAGNDKLYAEDGDDILIGGASSDYMVGGLGADIFRFTIAAESSPNFTVFDLIGDFNRAQGDKIDITNLGTTFVGNSAYTGVAGDVQYKFYGTTTLIRIDTNGDRNHDAIIQLTGNIALMASDFIL